MSPEQPAPWPDYEPDEVAFLEAGGGPGRSCPAPELLFPAQEGALPARLQSRIAAHLEHCGLCQDLLLATTDLPAAGLTRIERDRIRSRIAGSDRSESRGQSWRWWLRPALLLTAAGTLALVAGLWTVRTVTPGVTPAVPAQPAIALAAPSVPSVLRFERAPLPAENDALLWRSGRVEAVDETSRELARAHEAYRRGDFAAASHGFGLVAKLRQDDPLVHLYLGVSELHRHRFSEAVLELSTAQRLAGRDRTISSEAAWHLGYVFHRNGERERAIATFEDLCRGTTVRSALGCAAALELSRGAQDARR